LSWAVAFKLIAITNKLNIKNFLIVLFFCIISACYLMHLSYNTYQIESLK
jgi:hypothetical protein